MREPDFVIGDPADPYLRRWWVVPRNRWFNIYLHEIIKSDDDRALHDHPWWNLSLILRGSYIEITPRGRFVRMPWRPVFRRPEALHRLDVRIGPVWTLFVTGPRVREWGFACPQGWVHWQAFTAPTARGQVGRGCGEHDG